MASEINGQKRFQKDNSSLLRIRIFGKSIDLSVVVAMHEREGEGRSSSKRDVLRDSWTGSDGLALIQPS